MKGQVFKISHSDSNYISYIIGSIHYADQRFVKHLNYYKEIIDLTQVVGFEVDFNSQQPSFQDFIMPDNLRISEMVTEKRWHKMVKITLKKFSVDLNMFDQLYPMIILNILQERLFNRQTLFQLDYSLYEYAKSTNKKIVGLENTEDHYNIIRHINIKLQLSLLKDFLGNISKSNAHFDKLTALYLKGEIHELYKLTRKSLGPLRGTMLYARNRIIAANIRRNIQQSSICSVLGIAHLSGEKGIIHLMKQQGYQIEPHNLI